MRVELSILPEFTPPQTKECNMDGSAHEHPLGQYPAVDFYGTKIYAPGYNTAHFVERIFEFEPETLVQVYDVMRSLADAEGDWIAGNEADMRLSLIYGT